MLKKSFYTKILVMLNVFGLVIFSVAQSTQNNFPTRRAETPETWERDGLNAIKNTLRMKFKRRKAKNVILFVGDGMGISTLTAARILEGQLRGESGEENYLSFERFPSMALSKTYSVNQQTSASAPTASAMVTGIKTNEGLISVNQNVLRGDYKAENIILVIANLK